MAITQRLMKPGAFSLRFREDAPFSVLDAIERGDHLVVTPTRLEPISGFSDANILASSIYTGVIYEVDDYAIAGADLSWWLGTDEGFGPLLGAALETTYSLSAWISALFTLGSNGLTVGTVTNTGLSSYTAQLQFMTVREAVDAVCKGVGGAEWRMNPDGTLDAAKSPDLFVDDPTVVITRHEEGQDGAFRGLESTELSSRRSLAGYSTGVVAVGQGEGETVSTSTATVSTTLKTFANGTPVLNRHVNAPTEYATALGTIASLLANIYAEERREVRLSSRTYTVSRVAKPGDYVYVYDQRARLTDSANQIVYRGEVISPIKLRVYALTWPVERGMGVYLRESGATPTYTDLTDFIDYEDGSVSWDVGAAPRAANDIDPAFSGSAAYLGANPAVAERAATTPTLRCEARPPGSQALSTATGAAVQLTTENVDTSSFHDNSTNNTRLTAPVAGTYLVSYSMDIAATAGGDRSFWFAKNGGSDRYAATNAIGTTARHEACGTCDIELDAGDYVELIAYQTSGVSLFVGTQSWCRVMIRYEGATTS